MEMVGSHPTTSSQFSKKVATRTRSTEIRRTWEVTGIWTVNLPPTTWSLHHDEVDTHAQRIFMPPLTQRSANAGCLNWASKVGLRSGSPAWTSQKSVVPDSSKHTCLGTDKTVPSKRRRVVWQPTSQLCWVTARRANQKSKTVSNWPPLDQHIGPDGNILLS